MGTTNDDEEDGDDEEDEGGGVDDEDKGGVGSDADDPDEDTDTEVTLKTLLQRLQHETMLRNKRERLRWKLHRQNTILIPDAPSLTRRDSVLLQTHC